MSDDFYWQLLQENPEAIIWEEYEQAYLGIGTRDDLKSVAVYDIRVLQGLLIEELLEDKEYMDELTKVYKDNEEAITQQIIQDSVRTYVEKIFSDKVGKPENRPIFLDIPYLDSRYEMLEEE
tara:strand:+ start:1707 stop:2072 length:366 start_codon:yes stop_codon:yes gene_type:complete